MAAETPPPRLHVLMAREAPTGLILRRGPSNHVCTVGWDRKTDRFELGQWFVGRIYAEKCDLSPDGRHLVYFAARHRWDAETRGSWTAISLAPWVKAVSFWPLGDTYQGGGLFLDAKTVLIDGAHKPPLELSPEIAAICDPRTFLRGGLAREYAPPGGVTRVESLADLLGPDENQFYESRIARGGAFRDLAAFCAGWRDAGHARIARPATRDWRLSRIGRGGANYRLERVDGDETVALPSGAQWAEVDDWGEWASPPVETRIVWTEAGRLCAAALAPEGLGETRVLKDFAPMRFERREAPY